MSLHIPGNCHKTLQNLPKHKCNRATNVFPPFCLNIICSEESSSSCQFVYHANCNTPHYRQDCTTTKQYDKIINRIKIKVKRKQAYQVNNDNCIEMSTDRIVNTFKSFCGTCNSLHCAVKTLLGFSVSIVTNPQRNTTNMQQTLTGKNKVKKMLLM